MVRIMTESVWLGSWHVNGFNAAVVLAKYSLEQHCQLLRRRMAAGERFPCRDRYALRRGMIWNYHHLPFWA